MTAQVGPDSTMTAHASKVDYVEVIRAMGARDRNKGPCTHVVSAKYVLGKFQVTRTKLFVPKPTYAPRARVTQRLVPRDHRPIARAVDILVRAQETV